MLADVTSSSTCHRVNSAELINCARMEPIRPDAVSTPIADERIVVGNVSVDRQSSAFQPEMAQAEKTHATLTVKAADCCETAKRSADSDAKHMLAAINRRRPTRGDSMSSAERMLPGIAAAAYINASWYADCSNPTCVNSCGIHTDSPYEPKESVNQHNCKMTVERMMRRW